MNIAFSIRLRYALHKCTVCMYRVRVRVCMYVCVHVSACVPLCGWDCECVLVLLLFREIRSRLPERITTPNYRFPNLKRTETRSKNYNRLKISVDRRSFKFRHPEEARGIIHQWHTISDMECAYRSIHTLDETRTVLRDSTVRETRYYTYITI